MIFIFLKINFFNKNNKPLNFNQILNYDYKKFIKQSMTQEVKVVLLGDAGSLFIQEVHFQELERVLYC